MQPGREKKCLRRKTQEGKICDSSQVGEGGGGGAVYAGHYTFTCFSTADDRTACVVMEVGVALSKTHQQNTSKARPIGSLCISCVVKCVVTE